MDKTAAIKKCLVWDLDHTLWNGVLSETPDEVQIADSTISIIKTIDQRGILQSISSKNNHDDAIQLLKHHQIDQYFLHPQINWNPKSASIQTIADLLNISTDSLVFIDDQSFERAEVTHHLPDVMCIDATELSSLLSLPELSPPNITADASNRRKMYLEDQQRRSVETKFKGTNEEFLRSLEMKLTLSNGSNADLLRMEELCQRTNQLNTTGIAYSKQELQALLKSQSHTVLVVSLSDKFGNYGKIGLIVIEHNDPTWTLKLFLLSCRVMSRGIGGVILGFLKNLAIDSNLKLQADFLETDRNRMMYLTYKLAGFEESYPEKNSPQQLLILKETERSEVSDFLDLIVEWDFKK